MVRQENPRRVNSQKKARSVAVGELFRLRVCSVLQLARRFSSLLFLVPHFGSKLFVLVLPDFFLSLFDDTAHCDTPSQISWLI